MEQFLIYQVRINLLQQNVVTLNPEDTTEFRRIACDIVQLSHEIMNCKVEMLIDEYIPQIENLCVFLNTKRPFTDTPENDIQSR